jgi:hypothetical protein
MPYEFGDVVLVRFPFTNQAAFKQRPACIVSSHAFPAPYTHHRLFRGRPICAHSIFVDDAYPPLFPQMDVGHAADALVLTADRGQFTTRKLYTSGEPILQSRGKSLLSLDSYLSWMSRKKAMSRKRPQLLAAYFPIIDDAGFSHRAHSLRSGRTSAHDPLVVVRREGQQIVGAAHRICGSR